MQSLKKIALARASTHEVQPVITSPLNKRFGGWTHFVIRSYHRRIVKKNSRGKKKTTRNVKGYIFIYLARESGIISKTPVKTIHIPKETRRNFAEYARLLTYDGSTLLRAFN